MKIHDRRFRVDKVGLRCESEVSSGFDTLVGVVDLISRPHCTQVTLRALASTATIQGPRLTPVDRRGVSMTPHYVAALGISA
jgi:hypothetical protein